MFTRIFYLIDFCQKWTSSVLALNDNGSVFCTYNEQKRNEAIKGKVERFKVTGKNNVFFFSLIYEVKI